MPKLKLNQRIVDSLKFAGKRSIAWDADLPGFGVVIYPTSKAYTVQYRTDGTSRRVNLGSTAEHDYRTARDKAQDILVGATKGKDILSPAPSKRMTFRKAAEEWMALNKPKWSPATYKDYDDRFTRHIFPKLGGKDLLDVRPTDVEALHAALAHQPRNQDYCVTLIKAVFNFAVRARHLDPTHHNPATGEHTRRRKTEKKNPRVLNGPEVERFGVTLKAMEAKGEVSPHLAGLLRVSLLCGLRPGEARSAQWADVNFDDRIMHVVGKTGRREVPLSDAAIEALRKVQGYRQAMNPYVFIGRVTGKHIVGVAKQLDRIADKAGVKHFTPNTFRHSAATQSLAGGADVRAVQALLGHADLKTTTAYLHSDDDRKRKAAQHVERFAKGL